MAARKWIKIIGIAILGGLSGFAFLLYFTLKTKSTSLDSYTPFERWIGKTVVLKTETALFEETTNPHANKFYPYTLVDSTHTQWTNLFERAEMSDSDVRLIARVPAGARLAIEKAIQYTNGVSGFSHPMLFGTLQHGPQTYQIGYQWGKQSIRRHFDEIDASWQFPPAPWQTAQDTAWYALPVARWW